MTTQSFIVVRHSADGYDWMDVTTVSGDRAVAMVKAKTADARVPGWAAANPIVRVAAVVIAEEAR